MLHFGSSANCIFSTFTVFTVLLLYIVVINIVLCFIPNKVLYFCTLYILYIFKISKIDIHVQQHVTLILLTVANEAIRIDVSINLSHAKI